jgi:hypothetical protein
MRVALLAGLVSLLLCAAAPDAVPQRLIRADRDGDGIVDSEDKCPHEPEDKDGFEDADGCPDDDNDRDGIPDRNDKCPNDPETKNGFEDDDGCPDAEPENPAADNPTTSQGLFLGEINQVVTRGDEVWVAGRVYDAKGQLFGAAHLVGNKWSLPPTKRLNGVGTAIAVGGDGTVVLAGRFRDGGAQTSVAWWKGKTAFFAPQPGALKEIRGLAIIDGEIVAVGEGGTELALKLDGNAWAAVGPRSPIPDNLVTTVTGPGLIIGGAFSPAANTTAGVSRLSGGAWSPGIPLSGVIYALWPTSTTSVAIGGAFVGETPDLRNIAIVDLRTNAENPRPVRARAQPLASGVDGIVRAVAGTERALYVAGDFRTAGSVRAEGIAFWDGQWHPVGGATPFKSEGTAPSLRTLAVTPYGEVIVGGIIGMVRGKPAKNLAKWNPQTRIWTPLGQ